MREKLFLSNLFLSLEPLSLSVALSLAASLAPAPRVALYLAASLVSLSLHPRVTLSPPTCHLINMPNPSFNATCTSKRRSFGAALLVLRWQVVVR